MSTNSYIMAKFQEDDDICLGIYCHHDGYIEGVGQMLLEHYSEPKKIKDLIDLGDISSLEPELNPKGEHSFSAPEPGVTIAYHRDRGEDFEQVTWSYDNVIDESKDFIGYIYLYQENNWYLMDSNNGPTLLTDVLEQL